LAQGARSRSLLYSRPEGGVCPLPTLAMDRHLERCIASLMRTPERVRGKRCLERTVSSPKRSLPAEAVPEAPGGSKGDVKVYEDQPSTGATDHLGVLFSGLETVLAILFSRGRPPLLSVVREDVEATTGKSLTEERLGQVLALAGGMLEVRWVGQGNSAALEVWQRTEDSKPRPPTSAERPHRQAKFAAALAAAVMSGGPLPVHQLPPRPESPPSAAVKRMRPVEVLAPTQAGRSVGVDGSLGSPAERMVALRRRVQAREEAAEEARARAAAISAAERRVGLCEDAIMLHGIVEHFFGRGREFLQFDHLFEKGKDDGCSVTTETEVLRAACSMSFSVQVKRPLELEAARAAIALLNEKCTGWYCVEKPKYSERVGAFIRMIPGASSADALLVLRKELREAQEAQTELELLGAAGPIATAVFSPAATVEAKGERLAEAEKVTKRLAAKEAARLAKEEAVRVAKEEVARLVREEATLLAKEKATHLAKKEAAPLAAEKAPRLTKKEAQRLEAIKKAEAAAAAAAAPPPGQSGKRRRLTKKGA